MMRTLLALTAALTVLVAVPPPGPVPPEGVGRSAALVDVAERTAGTADDDAEPEGSASVPYRWPTTTPPPVVQPFRRPPHPWVAGHRGVDLTLPVGAPVLAAGPGVVVAAGPVAGRPVVSVAHGDGLRTTYEPVSPLVRPGQQVRAGDVLGTLTGPAHCPGGCLHWGARRGPDDYVDPLLLLRRATVRLYPSS